ncbi:16925_t:CDS:1, partial [Gigaspora rosea]
DISVITSVGASVCKSGHKTHVTCGEVLELNFATAIRNINTNQTVIKREMIKTNLKGGPGDSGGIVYTYSTNQSVFVLVVGTMVGGSKTRSYFLPLP